VLALTQQNYVAAMLKKFGLEHAHAHNVPAALERLTKQDSPAAGSEDASMAREYQSIVGSVLYASTCTRPDIAFAVNRCSSFNANPGEKHMTATKRILRYLKGTAYDGIEYRGHTDSDLELVGFADADWAGDADSARSCNGFVFMLGGGAISWSSKMQATVAKSSTEAEYVSLAAAVSEAKYLRQLLTELGCTQSQPTKIFEDNQGCIFMAKNDMFSKRVKHIDVAYHFVQESVNELRQVEILKIDTQLNPADCFTKALANEKFNGCRTKIMFVTEKQHGVRFEGGC
jgi:hypothetical protein